MRTWSECLTDQHSASCEVSGTLHLLLQNTTKTNLLLLLNGFLLFPEKLVWKLSCDILRWQPTGSRNPGHLLPAVSTSTFDLGSLAKAKLRKSVSNPNSTQFDCKKCVQDELSWTLLALKSLDSHPSPILGTEYPALSLEMNQIPKPSAETASDQCSMQAAVVSHEWKACQNYPKLIPLLPTPQDLTLLAAELAASQDRKASFLNKKAIPGSVFCTKARHERAPLPKYRAKEPIWSKSPKNV